MSFRFRLASRVCVSAFCLAVLGETAPAAGPQEPSTSPPPATTPGQPPAAVRPRMREHFTKGAEIRDAVIRADLEGVRAPATWLADLPQEDLPANATGNLLEMQRLAANVAKAPDLAQAAAGFAQLSSACGACHSATQATPTLIARIPKGEDESLQGRMKKHSRAADLLYRGLVVPSDYSWTSGAKALSGDPMELALKLRKGPQPEIEAMAKRLFDLSQEAQKADNPSARTQIYGQMLATCSDCHRSQKIKIKQAPAGN